MLSTHYAMDRKEREQLIQQIGYGKIIKRVFEQDIFYTISTTAIISIMNRQTYKVITRIIARPAQIQKYYAKHNETAPNYLLKIAKQHQDMGYNYI